MLNTLSKEINKTMTEKGFWEDKYIVSTFLDGNLKKQLMMLLFHKNSVSSYRN